MCATYERQLRRATPTTRPVGCRSAGAAGSARSASWSLRPSGCASSSSSLSRASSSRCVASDSSTASEAPFHSLSGSTSTYTTSPSTARLIASRPWSRTGLGMRSVRTLPSR